jgi:hypothetical protein
MQLRFPFLFTALDTGWRKVVVGDWAVAEIAERSPEEAPVLFSWDTVSALDTPYTVEVRQHDGKLYRPRTSVLDRDYAPAVDDVSALDVGNLLTVKPLRASYHSDTMGLPAHVLQTINASFDPYDVISRAADKEKPEGIDDGDRADVLRGHLEAACELISINGTIWEPCGEPRLRVCMRETPAVVSVVFSSDKAFWLDEVCYVTFDQAAALQGLLEALASAEVPHAQRTWTADEVVVPVVRIHDEDAFTALDPVDHIVARVNATLATVDAGRLSFRSSAFARAWFDLRDAKEAADLTPEDTELHLMLDAWGRFNNRWKEELAVPRTRTAHDVSHHPRLERARIRSCFEVETQFSRWNDTRPANLKAYDMTS